MKRMVLLLALAFLLVPSAALADTYLDFNISAPTAGTISYDPLLGPLVGSGITVDSVVGVNTPVNAGVAIPLTNGVLNFQTGPLTGWIANNWYFGGAPYPGSYITISDDSGTTGTTWMSGWFGEATVIAVGKGTYRVAVSSFSDYKAPELLNFYGLGAYSGSVLAGNFNISFAASGLPPYGFTSTTIYSGDVTNPVPEPGTLALLGTGLLGIAGLIRRKLAI